MVRSAARTIIVPLDTGGIEAAEGTLASLFEQLDRRAEKRVAGTTTQGGRVRPALPGPGVLAGPPDPDRGRKGHRAADQIARRFATAYERNLRGHRHSRSAWTIVSVRAIERTGAPPYRPTVVG